MAAAAAIGVGVGVRVVGIDDVTVGVIFHVVVIVVRTLTRLCNLPQCLRLGPTPTKTVDGPHCITHRYIFIRRSLLGGQDQD